ncbi:GGDEF domain-containing protein [Alicyclobacillus fastidiosus]|uniref:GGDEF domain-containing protein n=1 Tax=Alicyclobacillus fastidiosus TaxID=392011 RepID=UPI0024E0F701|nr:GGDEF domain-containing protein [Alicyclobacillus fastidiosus]
MSEIDVKRFSPHTWYVMLITTLFLAIFITLGSQVSTLHWDYIIINAVVISLLESRIITLLDSRFSMSMTSAVLLAASTNTGLFFVMCSLVLSAPILLFVYRHRNLIAVVFNIAQYGLSVSFAFLGYRFMGGALGHYKESEWALLVYVLVYGITNISLVSVYTLIEARQFKAWLPITRMVGFQTLVIYLIEMTIGIFMGVSFQTYRVLGTVSLPILLWLVAQSYRHYFEVAKVARTDSLTGLLNRIAFQKELESLLSRRQPFSVLMIDLDHFKSLNDTLGHLYGDQALIGIAKMLMAQVGTNGVVSRFGGEEFSVIVPGATEEALVISEQIREKVTLWRTEQNDSSKPMVRITTSIGIASFPQHGRDVKELLEHADNALYQAKTKRNTVEVYRYGTKSSEQLVEA